MVTITTLVVLTFSAFAASKNFAGRNSAGKNSKEKKPELRMLKTTAPISEIVKKEFNNQVQVLSEEILLVPDELVVKIASRLHEITGRCGGFIDVTDSGGELLFPKAKQVPKGLDGIAGNFQSQKQVLPMLAGRDIQIMQALNQIRGENIKTFVLSFSKFRNRYAKGENAARTSEWLRNYWTKLAVDAHRQDILVELVCKPTWIDQSNVRITIPGIDRNLPVVILGAHLDSINQDNPHAFAPGADDDASGIGTLTEIYRVMLLNGFRPRATVQIIGYAAEEIGLRGSYSLAKQYYDHGVRVRGVLQFDMIAFPGQTKRVTFFKDYVDPELSTWTEQLYGYYVGEPVAHDVCGYPCSDHAAWHYYRYPSVMPFETPFAEMNPRIHTAHDVWDGALDPEFAANFAKLGYAFAAELSK